MDHPLTLPVACRSLWTGARFGEELIGCRLFFQIRLVGAEHRYVYLFIRKGFVAGPEHTFPIQYLGGFKFQVQRVVDDAVAYRLPVA